jgi:hypothetical protein
MEIVVWVPTVVSILALIASIVIGLVNVRQAGDSAASAKRSADSSETSLDLAQKQLESSTAAQAESLRLAQEQLRNSVQAHQDSLQPYVWADLRPREDGSGLMLFMVGNSGATVAMDVRVEFQPALNLVVPSDRIPGAHHVEEVLTKGLTSLPAGKIVTWSVGMSWDFFDEKKKGPESSFEVTIRAKGPHGELKPLVYDVSLDSMKEQALRPVGLGLIEKPLNAVETRLKSIGETLEKIRRSTIPDE